uniref:Uncharacterized protein n=1 Tax=Arundo donax TaxID=35708 RepID=A0A0A9BHC6_ARUDO
MACCLEPHAIGSCAFCVRGWTSRFEPASGLTGAEGQDARRRR